LPKLKEDGVTLIRGVTPFPLNGTFRTGALETIVIDADLGPTVTGANTTTMVQVAPGARTLPAQGSAVMWNSAGFVPVSVTEKMVRLAEPVLVTTKDWDGEVWPTTTLPKLKDTGTTLIRGVGVLSLVIKAS
jgi:hypothetical protein